jgi:hypothetical protein
LNKELYRISRVFSRRIFYKNLVNLK